MFKSSNRKKTGTRSSSARPRKKNRVEVSHQDIAKRAYELWIGRGRPFGSPETDWFQAEAELTQGMARGR